MKADTIERASHSLRHHIAMELAKMNAALTVETDAKIKHMIEQAKHEVLAASMLLTTIDKIMVTPPDPTKNEHTVSFHICAALLEWEKSR